MWHGRKQKLEVRSQKTAFREREKKKLNYTLNTNRSTLILATES